MHRQAKSSGANRLYDPYEHYPLPILAIPGNHDGEPVDAGATTLEGFYRNFLAARSAQPTYTDESRDSGRPAMTQPFFYWTLPTPFATFIGLYSNVPEHGRLDDQQRAWFQGEMAAADKDKALVVAVHTRSTRSTTTTAAARRWPRSWRTPSTSPGACRTWC